MNLYEKICFLNTENKRLSVAIFRVIKFIDIMITYFLTKAFRL